MPRLAYGGKSFFHFVLEMCPNKKYLLLSVTVGHCILMSE